MGSILHENVVIHCYKHNGKIHRCWDSGYVLEDNEKEFILMNYHTLVSESDGRRWYTREPAICYFPKNEWYNVICMIRKTGVYFYCNIATPTLYDGEALKYIDYDLDLKVFPDYKYKILDQEEYEHHRKLMGYSDDLDHILKNELNELINMAMNKKGPFRPGFAQFWYDIFMNSYRRKA